MSKPGIKISLGKPKSSILSSGLSSATPVREPPANGFSIPTPKRSRLGDDSDSDHESGPVHEEVTGFDVSSGGAIASRSVQPKQELVIQNTGNGDWRRRGRGKNILPEGIRAQQEQQHSQATQVVDMVEVNENGGLQLSQAQKQEVFQPVVPSGKNGNQAAGSGPQVEQPLTEDERALRALLTDGNGKRSSNRVIEQQNTDNGAVLNELDDYKADVAARPESCTLDEYTAMPVEEFGMALLRGMGTKRKAKGETIEFGKGEPPRVREVRAGYLGIGAKGVPKGAEVEFGAWGRSAMRKNKNGEGLYTPVLLKDKRTGETLTEEELEARKKEAKGRKGEEDWRDRRDRNLKDRSRGDSRDQTAVIQRDTASRRSRSRSKDRDRSHKDRGYHRSSDMEDRERHRDRNGDRDRDHRKDRYRDDDRYDSTSSRRSGHRDRDEYRDRDRERYHDDSRRRRNG